MAEATRHRSRTGSPSGASKAPRSSRRSRCPTRRPRAGSSPTSRGLDLDAYERRRRPGAHGRRVSTAAERATVDRCMRAAPRRLDVEPPATLRRAEPALGIGSVAAPSDPFVARNEAAWRDGVLVYVPAATRLEEPIELDRRPRRRRGAAVNWRTLIVLEEGAEAEVWEHYGSDRRRDRRAASTRSSSCRSATAPTSATSATQDLSEQRLDLRHPARRGRARRQPRLGRARLRLGATARCGWRRTSPGRAPSARVTGAYAGDGRQHLDYDTTQEHARRGHDLRPRLPRRARRPRDRGLARDDQGRPGAQRTDAFQESRNLLLSTDAHADAIPGLEIEADDVALHPRRGDRPDRPRAALLPDARAGSSDEQAKRLVVEGFLEALVERLAEGRSPTRLPRARRPPRRDPRGLTAMRAWRGRGSDPRRPRGGRRRPACGRGADFERARRSSSTPRIEQGAELELGEAADERSGERGGRCMQDRSAPSGQLDPQLAGGSGQLGDAARRRRRRQRRRRVRSLRRRSADLTCFRVANVVLRFEGIERRPTRARVDGRRQRSSVGRLSGRRPAPRPTRPRPRPGGAAREPRSRRPPRARRSPGSRTGSQ